MLLGFYETSINGHRIIAHGGDTQYFHSDLDLFVDDGVGYFISFNSDGKEGAVGPLREAFYRSFADRYFPGPAVEGKVDDATAKAHAAEIAGSYISSRRSETNFLSVLDLLQPEKVVVNEDGTISTPVLKDLNGEPTKWSEIAPYVWRDVDGKGAPRCRSEGRQGRAHRARVDLAVHVHGAFLRGKRSRLADAGDRRKPRIVLALSVIFWPVAAIVRRRYRKPLPYTGREAMAYRWGRIGALLSLAAMGGWIGTILAMFSDLRCSRRGSTGWSCCCRCWARSPCSWPLALARWHLSTVWKANKRWLGKIWAVALVFAAAICAWVAVAFHLVGIGTNY